ncbi:MAG: spo0F [Gammaproteobacteria bacterium]|jgi:two-component system sensor histidine kinase BarA|nr:spo0F [Gammaproteobacteria bacterium]
MATILLVEDNELVRRKLAYQLECASHQVTTASNAEEALELLKKTQPSIMIADSMMPKISGASLTAEIKSRYPTLEIITISNNPPTYPIDYSDFSESLGIAVSFEKPVDQAALLMAIDLLRYGNSVGSSEDPKQDSEIDWDKAMSLADNHREFAEKMLTLLIKDLPKEIKEIKKAYSDNNAIELLQRTHKLHGALCYCGAVKLKDAAAVLEKALHNKVEHKIPVLVLQLELKANKLIKEVNALNFKS